ncbi:MAG: TonB-dependent receptor [Bacteroidales bacterium]
MKKKLINSLWVMSKMIFHIWVGCLLTSQIMMAGMSNGQSLEDVHVTLDMQNARVKRVLSEVEKQTDYNFFYNRDLTSLNKRVNLRSQDGPMDEVLLELSKQAGVSFLLIDKTITVKEQETDKKPSIETNWFAQPISGKVTDASTGETLIGANVFIPGTNIGTITDNSGNYSLNVPEGIESVTFSSIGYLSVTVDIGERTVIDVQLETDVQLMDEVIVIGYGTMRKSDLTGSVSSVDRQEIIEQPVYSIDNVLQGRTAGVQITSGGFRPGQASNILIRGQRSLAGSNAPLVVIDGIPVESGLMDIYPGDVESVEILKDASAAAIYGSRAANGVILITTRRGLDGRAVLEYSGYSGIQYTFNRLNLMDTPTYAQFRRDAYILDGVYTNDEALFAPWQLEAIAQNRTTDWQDLVFDMGLQQNHSLSVRGGTENTKYSISTNYDQHDATVQNNDYTRLSSRFSLDQDLSSVLTVGLSGFLSNSKTHYSVAFANVLKNSPMATPYDENGNISMEDELGDRNPLFDMQRENNLDERINTRILGTVYGNLNIIPGKLTFRTTYSPDFQFHTRGTYRRDFASKASKSQSNTLNTLYESILNYTDEYYEKHRIIITAMYGVQKNRLTSNYLSGTGLPYEHQLYHNLASAEIVDFYGTGLSEWALESYMLRVNYIYDDRYLLTLTGRVDGSSRLAEGNKYGLFPSMAIAWNVANEDFMSNVDFLSVLKLRLSIGETGNTGISPYQTQGLLRIGNMYSFSGNEVRYFEHGAIPNPDLKWEKTLSKNLGFTFSLRNNRFSGNVDIYENNTYDLMMNRNLPFSTGYSSVLQNIGETRNRGIEIELSNINIKTQDFTWSTDLNFATNRNEIMSLYGEKEDDVGNLWFIGQPINVNYYWVFDGIWQLGEENEASVYGKKPGDIREKDINNDGLINDDDRLILGSQDPSWIGGMTNRLQYKNFDFSFFIYTVQGTQHRSTFGSGGYLDLLSLQAHAYQDNIRDVQYWLPERPSNEFRRPVIGGQQRGDIQSYFDTSFTRVKNITLGYNFSKDKISRLNLSRARIYTAVQNPFTFTSFGGYDPEAARDFDMPNYTTFLFGVDLSF